MNKNNSEEDDLREEYDLTKLRVRKIGSGWKNTLVNDDELIDECNFDYSKSKPNRFAEEYWKAKKK